MQNITLVTYETLTAILTFELIDAISHLKPYAEQGVREAAELLETLFITTSPPYTIRVTANYFAFIAMDLIKAEKGKAYCKACKKSYDPHQLSSIPLGFGKTPFEVKLKREGGIIKRLFGKKTLICGNGGVAYECPRGHELISAITWTGILRIP